MNTPFEGFEPANTTAVPDILFDRLLAELNEGELKCILYIIRRTLGFKKTTDAISLNQFQHGIVTKEKKILDYGCGLKHRATIVRALNSLVERGYVEREQGKDPSGDQATTLYRIRFRPSYAEQVVRETNHPFWKGSARNEPPLVPQTNYPSARNELPVVRETNPQETVIQQTEEQELSVTASTSPDEPAVAPAHTHSFSAQEKSPPRSSARQAPPPGKKPVKSEHTPEALALSALYDSIALGPGKISGHPHWDWTAMEEMVAAHPTEEEMRLVYTHLKANQKKCSVQAVWENWTLLASLKKPVFVSSTPPRSVIVEDDEPQRPFLKPSDTHKSRYGALAAVGGGR